MHRQPLNTLFNQCLGNREGIFDMKGMEFMASARRVEVSFRVLTAELATPSALSAYYTCYRYILSFGDENFGCDMLRQRRVGRGRQ